MRLGSAQLIFLGGIVAAIAIASISEGIVRRAAMLLDAQTRDRIWRREAAYTWWWRVPDTLGIILIVVGIAKIMSPALGLSMLSSPIKWGYPSMAVGLSLVCIASSLRACLTRRSYAAEAPGTPASRNALNAAILVTFTELLLATGVCWFIFSTPIMPRAPKSQPAVAAKPTVDPATGGAGPQWVSEEDGVALLKGKDTQYFRALAKWDDFRTTKDGGRTLYLRDDIVQRKQAGLPTEEELKNILKDFAPAPPEPALEE